MFALLIAPLCLDGIRNARIENVGRYQSCMVSKVRIMLLQLPSSVPASAPGGFSQDRETPQYGMDWDVLKKPATPAANQVLTTVTVQTRQELGQVHEAINRMDDRATREVAQLRRTVAAQADELVRTRAKCYMPTVVEHNRSEWLTTCCLPQAAMNTKLDTLLGAVSNMSSGGAEVALRMP